MCLVAQHLPYLTVFNAKNLCVSAISITHCSASYVVRLYAQHVILSTFAIFFDFFILMSGQIIFGLLILFIPVGIALPLRLYTIKSYLFRNLHLVALS
jgi:hypothetical protein